MIRSIRDIFIKLAKWFQPKHKVEYSEEIPETPSKRTIYIIGSKTSPWLIVFMCPCGCKSIIHLNLLKEANPRWRYSFRRRKLIDISPSINRIDGCKSHFFVRNGKIDWVQKSKRSSIR